MLLLGILIAHLLLLLNLKFTAWPEMLLWPYMALHGLLPYKDVAIAHTPLLIAKLIVFYKLFGVGILQLKIFTWILIAATDLTVFLVVKKLWNQKIAILAVSTFAFWQMFFDGNGLWFDLLLVPISVLIYYLLQKKKYFWVGIIWALMFFTKQTAVWFLFPIGYAFVSDIFRRPLKGDPYKVLYGFILGAFLISAIWILVLWGWGILSDFYRWTINFGIFVLPRAQGQIQLPDLKNLVAALFPFSIFIPLILKTKAKNANLMLWAIAGTMGAYPRFEYFHFQPAIPFLAIASGLVLSDINKEKKFIKIFLALYLIGSLYLFTNFFIRNWEEGTRFYEADVADVAGYVKENSKPGDKIFVMNWWDNIYPLTGTLPATDPWVPQLSWYQGLPGIQEKEVSDLQSSKPKLILLQDYADTGLASYKPQKVYDYVIANYKLKEKVDGIEILIHKN